MNALERIDYFGKLWRGIVPHIKEPNAEHIARWLYYTDKVVVAGFVRVSKKFAGATLDTTFDPLNAYRYASATMKSISAQRATRAEAIQ